MKSEKSLMIPGIGVVIDDHVFETGPGTDLISKLLVQLEDLHIPHVKYDELPAPSAWQHFSNVSFILLDWELWRKPDADDLGSGITGGDALAQIGIENNINFLKGLREYCFIPVFIFSNEAPETIRNHLQNHDLICEKDGSEADNSFILIRKKADLVSKSGSDGEPIPLCDAINAWCKRTPSIYALTEWKRNLLAAQNQLFWDFYDKDPNWPSLFWAAYTADNDSPKHGLSDILVRNLTARLTPLELCPEALPSGLSKEYDKSSLRNVIELSICVPDIDGRLPANKFGCGDVFRGKEGNKTVYYLNIRSDCDCISRSDDPTDVMLYFLRGTKCSDRKLLCSDVYTEKYGFVRNMHHAYVFPVDDGKLIDFRFNDLMQITVAELLEKDFKRFGRLLPPHITDIRQRYAQWLQREGFPKIPHAAIKDTPSDARACHNGE